MSAGTGIFHSEMNASPVEPVEILQIWIMPKERNTHPVYKDFSIKELERPNELAVIVSPDGSTHFTFTRYLVLYRKGRSRKETRLSHASESRRCIHLFD